MSATHAGVSVLQKSRSSEGRRAPPSDLDAVERIDHTLGVLHGRWKVHLLFLMARGVHRHSRLLACLPGASKKVMTDTLRALERDGLVSRRVFAEVPVRVEYSLTPLGWTLTEPLVALFDWGEAHSGDVVEARRHSKSCRLSPARHAEGRALFGRRVSS